MFQAISSSYGYTLEVAPFQILSRYLAAYINQNGMDCDTFVLPAVGTQEETDSICGKYDFTTLASIQSFMNPVYLAGTDEEDQALKDFESESGMTKAEVAILFDTSEPTSFGGVFMMIQTDIIKPWYCPTFADATCSYELLAQLQWGSAKLTNSVDPAYSTSMFLTPTTDSMYTSWEGDISKPTNILSEYSPELYTYTKMVGLGEVSSDSVA
mmetsp:Transcript_9644/g.9314  ORF Transcript_9644/g.9314 Transcript_9644/m.9314 type:complete len:212 (+) Transcript_9644:502-1137(+)